MKTIYYEGIKIGEAGSAEDIWPSFTDYCRSVVIHMMDDEYYSATNYPHRAGLVQDKFYEITGLDVKVIANSITETEDSIYIEPSQCEKR